MQISNTKTIFMPLFESGWHTRSVLEGISKHFSPRSIHIATLPSEIETLGKYVKKWDCAPVYFYDENSFFADNKLSKKLICDRLKNINDQYQPGWFYQQLLKLGCLRVLPALSDWTLIWDSDLIPIKAWRGEINNSPAYALLQHKSKLNKKIVSFWEQWIDEFLSVSPVHDSEATFIPHHMWFYRPAIDSLLSHLEHGNSKHWLEIMIDSVETHETFSEYWMVASWMAEHYPELFKYHPYSVAGNSTERFFDDGSGKLSNHFKLWYKTNFSNDFPKFPSYNTLLNFLTFAYTEKGDALPSSLSLEFSRRHINKAEGNRHLEELRSRWIVRKNDIEKLGISLS
ncbi:MAG: DUF6492 family protein [Puniceicoccaceae bacterium]|nr:DUF6492 family protein [Puniceicoccaceae bacterium]